MHPSNSDGRLLAAALMTGPPEILAGSLVMLREIRMISVLRSRARALVSASDDELPKLLARSTDELVRSREPALLAIDLVTELNRLLEVPPRDYVVRHDLEDNCEELVACALESLRKSNSDFQGNDLTALVAHQLEKLVSALGEEVKKGGAEADAIVRKVRDYFAALPEEQQSRVQEHLGVRELSDEVIRVALVRGSAAGAFAILIQVAGFSAYTTAASLLAAAAGIIGIPLSFGVYSGLSSMIAIMASPLTFMLIVGGGGYWAYTKGEKAIRMGLVPLILAQLAASASLEPAESGGDERWTGFLVHWSEAFNACRTARIETDAKLGILGTTQAALDAAEAKLSHQQQKRGLACEARKVGLDELSILIRENCHAIAAGDWGASLKDMGAEVVERVTASAANAAQPIREGIFNGMFDRASRYLDSHLTERDLRRKSLEAAESLYHSLLDGTELPLESAAQLVRKLRELDHEIAAIDEQIRTLASEVADRESSRNRAQFDVDLAVARKSELESRWAGLEDVR